MRLVVSFRHKSSHHIGSLSSAQPASDPTSPEAEPRPAEHRKDHTLNAVEGAALPAIAKSSEAHLAPMSAPRFRTSHHVGLADPFRKKRRESPLAYPKSHTWRSLNRSFDPHFLPTKARNRPLLVRFLAGLFTRNVLHLTVHLDQDHMNGDQIVDHWDDHAIARTGGAFPSNGSSGPHRPTSPPLFPSLACDT
ncbi:hypothetical protein BHE74_00009752 [Ensete ventricosum]|nr:hypothetical protein GW17_00006346 [Ensete ventricosum]RWW81823.1 hypothetical protein BHE74_00009752 [Ensete ventricosum]